MTTDRKKACLLALRHRILTLDIAPGSDLDEAILSASYGISRTPLREVLQRLAGEGYVQQSPNRGARVASMDLDVIRSFFQTAPLIYASIARLAAEAKQSELAEIKEAQRIFASAVRAKEPATAALANHRFHAAIGELADNPYLTASLDRMLIDHTRLSQTFYRPTNETDEARILEASRQHDAMIAAFESGDAPTAVELTLKHWDLSRHRMEDFVRPDPLPLQPISEDDYAV